MDGIRRIHKQTKTSQPIIATETVALQRRSLLKYLFLGSGVFVAGKLFGSDLDMFAADRVSQQQPPQFKHFRIVETGKDLRFFDKEGHEIFTLDKTA